MEIVNRAFKGVWIPKEIWLEEHLSWMEKLFLVEIVSLSKKDGCYASNKYFSRFFKLSPSRCSQVISSLEDKGYVSVKMIYNPDRSIKKRVVFPIESQLKSYNNQGDIDTLLVSEDESVYG